MQQLSHKSHNHIHGGVRMSGGLKQKYKYVCGRKKLDDINKSDGLRKYRGFRKKAFSNKIKGGCLNCCRSSWYCNLILCLKKNVVHTSTAVERFRAAHCVYSGILHGGVAASRLHLRLFSGHVFR